MCALHPVTGESDQDSQVSVHQVFANRCIADNVDIVIRSEGSVIEAFRALQNAASIL